MVWDSVKAVSRLLETAVKGSSFTPGSRTYCMVSSEYSSNLISSPAANQVPAVLTIPPMFLETVSFFTG